MKNKEIHLAYDQAALAYWKIYAKNLEEYVKTTLGVKKLKSTQL